MVKQNVILLAEVLILALVLVAPVAADTLIANSATSQSAQVNTIVATPPSVKVINGTDPVSGVSVTFAITNGGGTITSGGSPVTSVTVMTGGNGVATLGSWTLGTTAGTNVNTLTATSGSLIGSPLIFTATGTPGAAAAIAATSVTTQSAPAGTAVTAPPTVIVKDVFNNPVSGTGVIFYVSSGSGTVASGSSTVTSDANGIATGGSWTLGSTAGTNQLLATSAGLYGSPVTFTATGTGTTAPSITAINPNSGYNTSTISSVQITGTGFSTTGAVVNMTKSGENNIPGACSVGSATTIVCSFPITGKTAGSWNVLVLNADGQSSTLTNGFTINSPTSSPTLSSISPSSGDTNTTVTISSLVGTNFGSAAGIRLRRSSYNDIIGSVSSLNADHTVIAGSFNLNNQPPGAYQVCVYNDASIYICGLTFTITSPYDTSTNSSVYFETNPTGAAVYVNGTKVGTTPFTYYNATPGTNKVLIQKNGYKDYGGYVTVITGKRVTYYAQLALPGADTTAATPVVTAYTYTTPVKTVTTIKKSTLKVPTTYATATTAADSPVDPALIIGAVGIGLGLVVVRRR
jgi:hypothetical protein